MKQKAYHHPQFISISEWRKHFSQVVDEVVRSGQSFIITRHSEPVAKLKPYRSKRK